MEDLPPPSTISTVAAFVRAPSIPDDVRARSTDLFLDTLGVAAAAIDMEPARIAREVAVATMSASSGHPSARLVFDGRPVSAPGAAFALGTQIDNLDAHDGCNPTKGHVGAAIIPAVLALAENQPDMDVLGSITVGYEVASRAAIALHDTVSDYHTSGAWNCLGVVAAAAHAMNLSDEVLRQALGIAEYHGPRSQMMREIATPTMLHDGSGMGAWVGLSSVEMARRGFTGAPAITVEQAPQYWEDLGNRWMVLEQYIKPYPVCRWAQGAMAAADYLRTNHRLDAKQIAKITVETFENAAALVKDAPQTTSEAQYSLSFAVASIFVHGTVGVAQVTEPGLSDPDTLDLLKRINVRTDAELEANFPAHRFARLTVETTQGQIFESGVHDAAGSLDDPFDRAAILDKFARFAGTTLPQARHRALSEGILALGHGSLSESVKSEIYTPVSKG